VAKILSKSGDSLADVYDVEGSIAGIDQLESREVNLVHEMGGSIFSERVSGALRRATSGAIAQSTDFEILLNDLPIVPSRIHGAIIFSDAAARIESANIALRHPSDDREIPFVVWDSGEQFMIARFQDNGAAVATHEVLVTSLNLLSAPPSMAYGSGQPGPTDEIVFRGRSTAFGAGTVIITAVIYLGHAQVAGLSSRGLPFPGW